MTRAHLDGVKKCLALPGIDLNQILEVPHSCSSTALSSLIDVNRWEDQKTVCEIARVLLAARADPDIPDGYSRAILHYARVELMKVILAASPPPTVDVRDDSGHTPLLSHASDGHVDECKLLIDAKADVNAVGKFKITALMNAVEKDCVALIPSLLEAKANVSLRNHIDCTALALDDRDDNNHTAAKDAIRECLDSHGVCLFVLTLVLNVS